MRKQAEGVSKPRQVALWGKETIPHEVVAQYFTDQQILEIDAMARRSSKVRTKHTLPRRSARVVKTTNQWLKNNLEFLSLVTPAFADLKAERDALEWIGRRYERGQNFEDFQRRRRPGQRVAQHSALLFVRRLDHLVSSGVKRPNAVKTELLQYEEWLVLYDALVSARSMLIAEAIRFLMRRRDNATATIHRRPEHNRSYIDHPSFTSVWGVRYELGRKGRDGAKALGGRGARILAAAEQIEHDPHYPIVRKHARAKQAVEVRLAAASLAASAHGNFQDNYLDRCFSVLANARTYHTDFWPLAYDVVEHMSGTSRRTLKRLRERALATGDKFDL